MGTISPQWGPIARAAAKQKTINSSAIRRDAGKAKRTASAIRSVAQSSARPNLAGSTVRRALRSGAIGAATALFPLASVAAPPAAATNTRTTHSPEEAPWVVISTVTELAKLFLNL